MRKILSYLKPYSLRIALGLLIKTSGTMIELVLPYILSHLIDEVAPTKNMKMVAFWGIVMVLCAITLIISDKYSIKVKSRAVMRFNALMLVITVAMFFLPSATASLFALVAVPAAMLIPLIFVRMGVGFTETLYRLMLVAAAANMVIMCL